MCLEKTVLERMDELQSMIEENEANIRKLREQNERHSISLDSLQYVLETEEKTKRKEKKVKGSSRKKGAPAGKLRAVPSSNLGPSGSLSRCVLQASRGQIPTDLLIRAYQTTVGAQEFVDGPQLLLAINALIDDPDQQVDANRMWLKLRSLSRSPHEALSGIFSFEGSGVGTHIRLNPEGVELFRKAC